MGSGSRMGFQKEEMTRPKEEIGQILKFKESSLAVVF
jgi:hypothetical protein